MSDLLMNVKINTTGSGKAIDDIRNSLRDLQKLAGAISGIQIGSGIIESFRDANLAAEQFIRSMNAVKGVGQGELDFSRLAGTANQFGLSLDSLTKSYTTFMASAEGTALEGFKAEQGFKNMSAALSVLGADSERTKRAFMAVSQMISKGQVYAEELRGQLAEQLPGAITIFAKSLGVSQAELLALVKAGKVGIPELEKFLNQLGTDYSRLAANMANPTMAQAVSRLGNQMTLLYREIGQTGAWDAIKSQIIAFSKLIEDLVPRVQDAGIAIDQSLTGWRNEFVSIFEDADHALNGFLSDLKNNSSQDFGGFILESLVNLPGNIRASVVILEGELGKAAITLQSVFAQAFEYVSAIGQSSALEIKIAYQSVIAGIQQMLASMAGSMADSLAQLGKSGEVIPGFRSSMLDMANGLRAMEQSATESANKLQKLRDTQDQVWKSYAKAKGTIEQTAQSNRQAWDDTIQAAIRARDASISQRDTLTSQLQYYRKIDQAEQKLWGIRVQNLNTQQQITGATSATKEELKKQVGIFAELARIQKELSQLDSGGVGKGDLVDVYSKLVALQRQRGEIDRATTTQERQGAISRYGDLLKELAANTRLIQSDEERARALRLLDQERRRLAESGITDPTGGGIRLPAKLDGARIPAQVQQLQQQVNQAPPLTLPVNPDTSALSAKINSAFGQNPIAAVPVKLDPNAPVLQASIGSVAERVRKGLDMGLDMVDLSRMIKGDGPMLSQQLQQELQAQGVKIKMEPDIGKLSLSDQVAPAEIPATVKLFDANGNQYLPGTDPLRFFGGFGGGYGMGETAGSLPTISMGIKFEKDAVEKALADLDQARRSEALNQAVGADITRATSTVDELVNDIESRNPTLTVNVRYNDPGYMGGGGTGPTSGDGFAKGGLVGGPRWPADKTLIRASGGEYVVPPWMIPKLGGLKHLEALRRGAHVPAIPKLSDRVPIPRYASGGPVSGSGVPVIINVPGGKTTRVTVSSRDQAKALAGVLAQASRAL